MAAGLISASAGSRLASGGVMRLRLQGKRGGERRGRGGKREKNKNIDHGFCDISFIWFSLFSLLSVFYCEFSYLSFLHCDY